MSRRSSKRGSAPHEIEKPHHKTTEAKESVSSDGSSSVSSSSDKEEESVHVAADSGWSTSATPRDGRRLQRGQSIKKAGATKYIIQKRGTTIIIQAKENGDQNNDGINSVQQPSKQDKRQRKL